MKGGMTFISFWPRRNRLALGAELLGEGVEAVVGQHDALGRAGGAAGVHHHAGVLRVVGLGGDALALAAVQ